MQPGISYAQSKIMQNGVQFVDLFLLELLHDLVVRVVAWHSR